MRKTVTCPKLRVEKRVEFIGLHKVAQTGLTGRTGRYKLPHKQGRCRIDPAALFVFPQRKETSTQGDAGTGRKAGLAPLRLN